MPLQMPDSFEKIEKKKKNVPELHLVAIFYEKKSETVTKHRVTRSKITLFRLAIPKMAGFWKKKSGIFGVLGLSGLRILLSYFWPAPLQRPKGKKSAFFFSTANGSKPPPNHFSPKSALAYPGPWAAQGSGGTH